MASENEFLLHALIMGIYITFVYDILRIFRRVVPHVRFWVSAEDCLFWIYCAAEVFLLMHHESDGTLRWFAILGALTGMLVYKKTLGPPFVKYVSFVLQKLFFFLGKIVNILLKPFRAAGRVTTRSVNKVKAGIFHRCKRIWREVKKKLTYFLKVLKMNL